MILENINFLFNLRKVFKNDGECSRMKRWEELSGEEIEKVMGWYRNLCKFSEKYFPGEDFTLVDRVMMFGILRERIHHLDLEDRYLGSNIRLEVSRGMGEFGYNVRKTK